ncbi:MAG: hypothetical protein ACRD2C_05250, partial [Acidimicrobiales bacterium]
MTDADAERTPVIVSDGRTETRSAGAVHRATAVLDQQHVGRRRDETCGHDFQRIAFQTVGLRPTLAPLERVDAVGINTARPAPRLEPQRKAGRCRRGMVRAQ